MPSEEAKRFWEFLRALPKDVGGTPDQWRQGDECAEEFTREPEGVNFAPAPAVDGLWATPSDARPGAAILYFHGGGYVVGLPVSRRKTAGHLAAAAKARALLAKYRRAPEHPFPAALEDGVAAYQCLIADGAAPSRTVIAGDSAGGGLALATALSLRDRGLPRPGGVVAISAWTDMTLSGDSMESRAEADISCSRDGLLELAGMYLSDHDPRHPLASPVFADFVGLPPILCLVGGEERLLDDSVRVVRSAGMAGVDATLVVAAGMQHVFPIFAGAFPEADAAITVMGDWIRARQT